MKRVHLTYICAGLLGALPQMASATPLRMDYSVVPVSGLFHYDFTLTLDNHDGTFAAGQGWGWLIFGDQSGVPSNLTNFVMDSGQFPVGPWTSLSSSGGGHNGPTFAPVGNQWTPTTIGTSLHWAGTSNANLADGQLLFSTLIVGGGAVAANFEVAHLSTVPEPASMAVLGVGALALLRRKRNHI